MRAVAPGQVGVLLVRQRLDRCRVEGLAALGQGLGHGVLGDDGLARARWARPRAPSGRRRWRRGPGPGRRRGRTRTPADQLGPGGHHAGRGSGLLLAALEDPADDDRDLVEDAHRHREHQHADRVARWGDDGHDDADPDDRVAPGLLQRFDVQDADELQEHEQDRELEADAERQHHVGDQAEVLVRREGRHEVARAADGDEELQGLGQRVEGQPRAHDEQRQRAEQERDGVLLLVVVEARGDELPQLPEDHRHGDGDAAVGRHLHADPEAAQRVGEQQLPAGERAVLAGDVLVGPQQELEDVVVEQERDRHAEHEGDGDLDDAVPELREVLHQGHAGRVGLGAEGGGGHQAVLRGRAAFGTVAERFPAAWRAAGALAGVPLRTGVAFLAGAFFGGAVFFAAGARLAGAFLVGAFLAGAFLAGPCFGGAVFLAAGAFRAGARFVVDRLGGAAVVALACAAHRCDGRVETGADRAEGATGHRGERAGGLHRGGAAVLLERLLDLPLEAGRELAQVVIILPALRAASGRRWGPSTTRATRAIATSSRGPTLNMAGVYRWGAAAPGSARSPSWPPGSPPSAAPRSASPTAAPGPTPRRTPSRPSGWPCGWAPPAWRATCGSPRRGRRARPRRGRPAGAAQGARSPSCARDELPEHIPTLAELYDEPSAPSSSCRSTSRTPPPSTATVAVARDGGRRRGRAALAVPPRLAAWWPRGVRAAEGARLVDSTWLKRIPEGVEQRAAALADAGIDALNLHHSRVDRRPGRPLPPLRRALLRLGRAARPRSSTTCSTPAWTASTPTTWTAWSTPSTRLRRRSSYKPPMSDGGQTSHEGPADDRVDRDRPAVGEPAVGRVVAVVAHHEDRALGHRLLLDRWVVGGDALRQVRLLEELAVDVHLPLAGLDDLARAGR